MQGERGAKVRGQGHDLCDPVTTRLFKHVSARSGGVPSIFGCKSLYGSWQQQSACQKIFDMTAFVKEMAWLLFWLLHCWEVSRFKGFAYLLAKSGRAEVRGFKVGLLRICSNRNCSILIRRIELDFFAVRFARIFFLRKRVPRIFVEYSRCS